MRLVPLTLVVFTAACGSANQDPAARRPATAGAGGAATPDGGGTTGTIGGGGGGGTGVIRVPDAGRGDQDQDKDGYTSADGDCNNLDPNTNPGAFDVPGNMVDEDCNGTPDDEASACDDGLPVDGDAVAAAKAIGICRTAIPNATGKDRTWGLVSAKYVFADGSTTSLSLDSLVQGQGYCSFIKSKVPNEISHGIQAEFGPNVKARQGAALTVLSSGVARAGRFPVRLGRSSPFGGPMCTRTFMPDGFPVSSYTTCGDLDVPPTDTVLSAFDGIALEVVVRAPTNAKSFAFDFDFYTYEYSEFVCSPFNDAFVALLFSKSPDVPANHNIAFDAQNNPVSVNNGFVEVCDPYVYMGMRAGRPFSRSFTCQFGTDGLKGTGFEATPDDPESKNHAATGWLQTHANVVPGEELTLRFAIWDAGDDWLDSTVLVDNFVWAATPGEVGTIRPPPPPR